MARSLNGAVRTGRTVALPLTLCLILALPSLQADEINETDAVAAVETWVRHVTADARPDAVIERMEPHVVHGQTVGYIAHLMAGGFCLCGANDLVLPVYLYSPGGTYDPGNSDCQYILWEIGTRLTNLQKALEEEDPNLDPYEAALADRAAFWQDLISRRMPEERGGERSRAEPDMMVLHLTCTWHQHSPYNDQCPVLPPPPIDPDDHTIVGCVATAMSQIMYYWQWPHSGQGQHDHDYNFRWSLIWLDEPLANDPNLPPNWGNGRLDWTSAGGGTLQMFGHWDGSIYSDARRHSDDPLYRTALANLYNALTPASTNHNANFGATTYDWSIINDVHSDPPDAGDAEVAKLCYHAGISVDMDWGLWGSFASTATVADALEDYFRYDPDTSYSARDIDIMTEEIQWLRPLEFRATDPNAGGHAWVVYGYNKATDPHRQFLMNMGWGGPGDNWYSCDNINPLGFLFNIEQHHVTYIAPAEVVGFVGDTNPGDGSPDDPYENLQEAVQQAPDGATLIFKAGSISTFTGGPLVIDRPLTLRGCDVVVQGE